MSKTATILAVSVDELPAAGSGVIGSLGIYGKGIPDIYAGPRQPLETDERFRQLIPYVLVRHYDKYLAYTRSVAGGESRLHGAISIGFGGHVDAKDAVFDFDGSIRFQSTVDEAATRELAEEIGINVDPSSLEWHGYIISDATPTDRVHLGIVLVWDAEPFFAKGGLLTFEDAIGTPEWLSKADLIENIDRLESWSKLALDLL